MKLFYFLLLIPVCANAGFQLCNQSGQAIQDDIPGNIRQEAPLNNEMYKKIKNSNQPSLLLRYQCFESKTDKDCEYTVNVIVPKILMSPKYEEVFMQNHFGRYNTTAMDIDLSTSIVSGDYQTEYYFRNVKISGLKVVADLMKKGQLLVSNFTVGELDTVKPFYSGTKSGNLVFPGFPGGSITFKAKYWKIKSVGITISDKFDRGDISDLTACLQM